MFTGLTCRIFLPAIMAFIHQILGFVEDIGIDHHDAPSNPVRMSALHDWPEDVMPNTSNQALSLSRLIYRKTGFLWAVLRVSVLFLLISATWTGTLAVDLAQPEGAMNATNATDAINATTPENLGGGPFERGGVDGPQNNSVKDYAQINNNSIINNEAIQATMLKLPLSFIENKGQSSEDVKFMVKTAGQTVFFTPSEVVFALSSGNNSSVVHMAFEGSRPGEITGEQPLPGRANFFIGNDSSIWSTEVPTYGAIRYKDLYPGVDLVFKGTEAQLKHELVLSPGADPAQIVLTYSGQDNLSLEKDGSILIKTTTGNLTDSAPVCYQEINGSKKTVEGRYRLIEGQRIGFEIGSYDKSHSLVIDPALVYSTYLGGSLYDHAFSIALDNSGNAYIAGGTMSYDFPIQNPIYPSHAGIAWADVFVTKINVARSALVYSTFLGGWQGDQAFGIAVDGSGNAYITGCTESYDLGFPDPILFPIQNPIQASNAGMTDAFVTKIDAAGSALVYSTYLGGSNEDFGHGIDVDDSGNAYVTGSTDSPDFPTHNPYQGTIEGNNYAFVTKLSPGGDTLVYSTCLGGRDDNSPPGLSHGYDIAVDISGNAYITGSTDSPEFPTQNPYQGTYAGGYYDAFVTKLSPGGNTLVYSTYLGGSGGDQGYGIAVDGNDNAYVTGETTSSFDFSTQNPIQTSSGAIGDAFITKINAAGSALVYSTYLGGGDMDRGYDIAIDGGDNAYVTGYTFSYDFPTQNPIQASNGEIGEEDAFVTKINAAGSAWVYSTYLGGSNNPDCGEGIAVDSSGNAYVTGYTSSTNFPTKNPYQGTNAGGNDAFVAVLSSSDPTMDVCHQGCDYSTIQGAVDAANPGDTINVAEGTYTENVHIEKSLTIKGAGEGKTVVDGNQANSVFTIDPDIDVALSGMTIQNGMASGGGVKNKGRLTISDIKISANRASASYGGGVFNTGTLTMNSGTISGNSAMQYGGGVFNDGSGSFMMNGGTISGNSAQEGGGVCNNYGVYGDFNMNGGTISGNSAQKGGGVCNHGGIFNMKGGIVSGNSAQEGGGIFIDGPNYGIVMSGTSQIIDNQATSSYGGGIYSANDKVTLDGINIAVKSNKAQLPSPSELNWYQGWGVYLNSGIPTTINGFDPATQVNDNTLLTAPNENIVVDLICDKNAILETEQVPIKVKVSSNSNPVAAEITLNINGKSVAGFSGPELTYLFGPSSVGSYDIMATASVGEKSESKPGKIEVIGDITKTLSLVEDLRRTAQNEIYQSEDKAIGPFLKSLVACGLVVINEFYLKVNVKEVIDKAYPIGEHPEIGGFIDDFATASLKVARSSTEKMLTSICFQIYEDIGGKYSIKIGKNKIDRDSAEFIDYIYANRVDFRDHSKFEHIIGIFKTSIGDIYEAREIFNSPIGHTEYEVRCFWDGLDWWSWVVFGAAIFVCLLAGIVALFICGGTLGLGCIMAAAGSFAGGLFPTILAIIKGVSMGLPLLKFSVSWVLMISMFLACGIVPNEHFDGLNAMKEISLSPTMSSQEISYPMSSQANDILTGQSMKISSNGYIFVVRPDGRISRLEDGEFMSHKSGRYIVMGYGLNGKLFSNIAATNFKVSEPNITINASYTITDRIASIELQVSNHESSTMENLITLLNIRNSTKYYAYLNGDSINLAAGESKNLSYEVNLEDNDIYTAKATVSQNYGDFLAEKTFPIPFGISTLEDAAILDISRKEEYSPHNNVTLNVTVQSYAPALAFNISIPSLNYTKPVVVTGTQVINITLPILKPDQYIVGVTAEKGGKVLDSRMINFYVSADGVGLLTFNTSQILYTAGISAPINLSLKDLNQINVDAQVGVDVRNPAGETHEFAATKTSNGYQFDFLPTTNGTYMLEAHASKEGWRIENNTFTVIVDQMSSLNISVTMGEYILANVTANGQPAACNVTIYTPQGNKSIITSNGLALFNATNQFYIVADKMFFEPAFYAFKPFNISGTKFDDANGNGTRDESEAGLSGWTIKLIRPDGTSINTTTDANGMYKFENLTSGTYTISEFSQSGWVQTYPASLGAHVINIMDKNITNIDFGNQQKANVPPNIPTTPSGSNAVVRGTAYSYSTTATDPDDDQIAYIFDWGDGMTSETDLIDSGTIANATHSWNKSGTYQVMAKATDSKGASSEWSGSLNVTINTPPNTPVMPSGQASGIPGTSYSYSTSTNDPDGDQVKYTFDWGDGTTSVTSLVNSSTIASASHKWTNTGIYQVKAKATDSNGLDSEWSNTISVSIVNRPPNAPDTPIGVGVGFALAPYSYATSSIDPDGDQVKYTFDWGDGTTSVTSLVNSGTSTSSSHTWTKAGTYQVKANATDSKGATSGYSSILTVTVNPNKSPNAPSKPLGSAKCVAGSSYSYSTSATDPDKDKVKYTFDWGDGTKSETGLVTSGIKSSAMHAWSVAGPYQVKANATDSKGAVSGYSSSLTVTVNPNKPPTAPSKPLGSATCVAGSLYIYSTSAKDPDGDTVKYTFDWGDGTKSETGLVKSGIKSSATHAWSTAGTYLVKANATDFKGAVSGYSGSLTITVNPNKSPNAPSKPSGSAKGYASVAYSYTTSATDPDKDQVKYTFDWGDGTKKDTNLVNSGTKSSSTHAWSAAGTYQVKANATDSKGAVSGYSVYLSVTISPNGVPGTPSVPSGAAAGKIKKSYSYKTSATDPDGDKLKYTFDWGDGKTSVTSLVNSGTNASSSHAWSSAGAYQVKVMATDSKGATSVSQSNPLTVMIT